MFMLKVMRLIIVAGALGLVACGQKAPLQQPAPPADKNTGLTVQFAAIELGHHDV